MIESFWISFLNIFEAIPMLLETLNPMFFHGCTLIHGVIINGVQDIFTKFFFIWEGGYSCDRRTGSSRCCPLCSICQYASHS